jgi:biotin/methionine sulfoxide reductase
MAAKYTAAHWGVYEIDAKGVPVPLREDSDPSRVGNGWLSAAQDAASRIAAPVARKGWLAGDCGQRRCDDSFVEIGWDRALTLVAGELERVRSAHGNGAIFAGSYGWASAGRFHHPQGQMRRFLNLIGGHVGKRDAYSFAAAEVLFPRILGVSKEFHENGMTSWELVAKECSLLVAFGGLSRLTAQVDAGGTSDHRLQEWQAQMATRGAQFVSLSPRCDDFPGAEWISIRPGTDVATMLALSHEILEAGRQNEAFLARYTSGWPEYRAYLLGEHDGQPKSADWAAPLCDVPAEEIRRLALRMTNSRTMISVTWSLQRAEHGEQPLWAALALAAMLGQMAQPGLGFGFGDGSSAGIGRNPRGFHWPAVRQGTNSITDYIPVARITDMLLSPGAEYVYDGETRRYPDIRLIYWAGGNPFHQHQDLFRLERAWQRPETVIVHEHSWTATARRADLVLPCTTPLERTDLMINKRDTALIFMSPCRPPYGEAKDDHEIFRLLAQLFGVEEAFTENRDVEGWLRMLWAGVQSEAGRHGMSLPDFDAFRRLGRVNLPPPETPQMLLRDFFADPEAASLKTESGRITLFNRGIAALGLANCPGHPAWVMPTESLLTAEAGQLHLISGQPATRLHSQKSPAICTRTQQPNWG